MLGAAVCERLDPWSPSWGGMGRLIARRGRALRPAGGCWGTFAARCAWVGAAGRRADGGVEILRSTK